jgi:uncharacterized protein YbjQ (UPF0145 family)
VPLPPAARRRIETAKSSPVWSAAAGPGEQVALQSVGFEPVGVVTAKIPSWPFVYRYPPALRLAVARAGSAAPSRSVATGTIFPVDDAFTAKRAGGFTRDYIEGTSGGILPDLGFSWQRMVHEERERQLFAATLDCLRQEAQGLAAHGIVSITLTWDRRPDLDIGEMHASEISAVGLAVRATDSSYDRAPFTAALAGSDIAVLLRSGFAPSELVFGIGIVKARMGNRTRKHMRSMGLADVGQFSEAVSKSLSIATNELERTAAARGDLVVGCQPHLSIERVPGAGLESCTRLTGTAVRRFVAPPSPDPLLIMRLHSHP